MIYAGIGSRSTPAEVCELMYQFARARAAYGWILRSGGANGADLAFETGARDGHGEREIYLPWRGFNDHNDDSVIVEEPTQQAMDIAAQYHPGWRFLKHGGKRLMARNGYQILGRNLDPQEAVDMVICWTPDGSLDGTGPKSGGTGQALRLAAHYCIPVYNLQHDDHYDWVAQAATLVT